MIKILLVFLLICPFIINAQNFEFKYIYEVCNDSKLIVERLYDSKTGIYKEINYNRNTFIDTTNINNEIFEAYIPLNIDKKKDIYSLVKNSNSRKNTLIYGSPEEEDYIKITLFLYENDKLINNDNGYLEHKNITNDFNNLLQLILNFIQSSEEYNRVFYWYGEKK